MSLLTLLQVVVLDDVISLILFSIAASLIGTSAGDVRMSHVLMPIIYNIIAIFMGFIGGIILNTYLNQIPVVLVID